MKVYFFAFIIVCIFGTTTIKCFNTLDNYFSQSNDGEYTGNKIRKSLPFLSYEESPIHPFIRFKKNNGKDSFDEEAFSDTILQPSLYNKRLFSRHQMAFRSPSSFNYFRKNEASKD
uniref:Neuropeptide-Like Protein n=1 Tax=Strongyloides venezuelensis TaxID=75913 RepID=A0A0K0EY66_STRVS